MYKMCGFTIGLVFLFTSLGEAAYLPDYEYDQDVGWLRLHIVPATWPDARLRCHLEDAALASPTTSAIAVAMRAKMLAYKLAESSVFTDMHKDNTIPKGDFTTIDGSLDVTQIIGLPVTNISLQWADGEPNNLDNNEDCLAMTGAGELADVSCASVHPYFCIKSHAKIPELNCDTTSSGYQLEPSTGSCYKFHRQALQWRRAAMVCAAEHAHLAVINSELESQVLKNIFAQNPSETIEGAVWKDFAHIGFLDWNEQSQWLTIFGETLAEAGYNTWSADERNHPGVENCGTMTRQGLLNDGNCAEILHPFICESTLK